MPVPFKVKVGKVGHSLRITIPKQLVDYINIKQGDVLELTADNGSIINLKKVFTKNVGK